MMPEKLSVNLNMFEVQGQPAIPGQPMGGAVFTEVQGQPVIQGGKSRPCAAQPPKGYDGLGTQAPAPMGGPQAPLASRLK
jgi:hypothetical protein